MVEHVLRGKPTRLRVTPRSPILGIKWESNAHNCLRKEATRRTGAPNLNSILVPDGTRQTACSGFTDRCLDHLATLGCKGRRCRLAIPMTHPEPRMAAVPANSSQDRVGSEQSRCHIVGIPPGCCGCTQRRGADRLTQIGCRYLNERHSELRVSSMNASKLRNR